ncbi:hypothetical protein L198_00863 [Cryptococcus wingfieldii CBS 7118]|uniref:Bacteriophage T5 Orf172 DNA-binding domain-containing protein n=1 Tax=Cryptococcus wingfieldii CBS 7118 TaxID=1295528 RepID=A0A1E3K282_9TREE|nr:hypothetical protein L198_00863 [Cryptococcus wingfieldii CBS 7118]ODO07284.1 hypothetical protein L198_00863 [Cryptococcus wingfieldii CBS 7118]
MPQPSNVPFPTPPSYRTDSSQASSTASYVTAHSSPYNPPNPAYTPPHREYPPNYYAATQPSSPQQRLESQVRRSRGNEYLLGLNTAMSNLELHGNGTEDAPPRLTNTNHPLSYQEGESGRQSYYAESPRQRYHSTPAMSPISPNTNKTLPPLPSGAQSRPLESFSPSGSRASPSRPQHMAGASSTGGTVTYGLPPPPPLPPRPTSLPQYMLPYANPDRSSPQRYCPSQHVAAPDPRSGLSPGRPQSDPQITAARPERRISPRGKENFQPAQPGPSTPNRKAPQNPVRSNHRRAKSDPDGEYTPVIDLTVSSPESPSSPSASARRGPKGSSPSRYRAHSDIRSSFLTSPSPAASPARRKSPSKPTANTSGLASSPKKPLTPSKVGAQCSGFTRTGAPCKRIVRAHAPYIATPRRENDDDGDVRSERVMGRYCKDHAGMICKEKGFYWRNGEGEHASKVWVDFEDYVLPDLSEQTQTLIRMVMESKLTPKEAPGYLYVYELRGEHHRYVETDNLSFYKCGRTDNVPRRIGQWTHQCQSKTPSLLDIFPRPNTSSTRPKSSAPDRSQHLITSFLQGATTHVIPPLPAMKRWERLVHIELAERCALEEASKEAFDRVRLKCADCNSGHKEIFPLLKQDSKSNYYIVEECVERWGRFIEAIHQ